MQKSRLAIFIALAVAATPAHAYIGPGAALGLIGTFFGLGAAVALAVIGLLSYPAFLLYKRWKRKKSGDDTQ